MTLALTHFEDNLSIFWEHKNFFQNSICFLFFSAKNENSADPQESITHPKQIEAMNDFQELHSADCRTDEEMSDLQYSNNQITAYDFADTHLWVVECFKIVFVLNNKVNMSAIRKAFI